MTRSTRFTAVLAVVLAALAAAAVTPSAQTPAKKPLTVDDYTKWKSIGDAAISADGKWVTYVLQTTNVPQDQARPVLHVFNVQTKQDVAVRMRRAEHFRQTRTGSRIRSIRPAPAPGGANALPIRQCLRRRRQRRPADPATAPPAAPTPAAQTPAGAPAQKLNAAQTPSRGARRPPPPRRVELKPRRGNRAVVQDIGAFIFLLSRR
jgi:hypothetical protein